jgi:hypothetical protein
MKNYLHSGCVYVYYCARNVTRCTVVEAYLLRVDIMVQVGPSPHICSVLIFCNRSAQITTTRSPWRQNILRWRLMF